MFCSFYFTLSPPSLTFRYFSPWERKKKKTKYTVFSFSIFLPKWVVHHHISMCISLLLQFLLKVYSTLHLYSTCTCFVIASLLSLQFFSILYSTIGYPILKPTDTYISFVVSLQLHHHSSPLSDHSFPFTLVSGLLWGESYEQHQCFVSFPGMKESTLLSAFTLDLLLIILLLFFGGEHL